MRLLPRSVAALLTLLTLERKLRGCLSGVVAHAGDQEVTIRLSYTEAKRQRGLHEALSHLRDTKQSAASLQEGAFLSRSGSHLHNLQITYLHLPALEMTCLPPREKGRGFLLTILQRSLSKARKTRGTQVKKGTAMS